MANWKGKPKVFSQEVYDPKNFGYGHHEDVEFNWEYQTTADVLVITEKGKITDNREYYSKEYAEALLRTMADWYATYEGVEDLKDLLKEILAKDT